MLRRFRLSLLALALGACGSSSNISGGDSGADAPHSSDASDAHPHAHDARPADAPHDVVHHDAHPQDAASDARVDSGMDSGFVPGMPITAPAETWTFIPFSDAFCGDGSTTGIGVNLSTKSTRALIYLEGGGGCWDALTCYTLMTASYFTTGYGSSDFAAESTDATYLALPGGFFDRAAPANPFKDYSYVYVPYCTGDLQAGNNLQSFPMGDAGSRTAHFVGYANFAAYLSRIVPTFPGADRVFLAGSSSGGMGAVLNWGQAQAAFGSVRVDVIDDSGVLMPADIPIMFASQQASAWNLSATLPAGCTACSSSLAALYPYYQKAFPGHELALLLYSQDSVLPSYYGITETQFTMGLNEVLTNDFVPTKTFKSFTDATSGHVLWFSPLTTVGTVSVQQFLTEMVTDTTSWATVP